MPTFDNYKSIDNKNESNLDKFQIKNDFIINNEIINISTINNKNKENEIFNLNNISEKESIKNKNELEINNLNRIIKENLISL